MADFLTSLPPTVLSEIFSYIPGKQNFRNINLTSKTLRELHLRTPSVMQRVKFILPFYADASDIKLIKEFLIEYGKHIGAIFANNYGFIDRMDFTTIMSYVPNIEELRLLNCYCGNVAKYRGKTKEEVFYTDLQLDKLKYLSITHLPVGLFEAVFEFLMKTRSLETLLLYITPHPLFLQKCLSILHKNRSLKTLILRIHNNQTNLKVLQQIFPPEINYPCKLHLRAFETDSELVWNQQLFIFLKSQVESLRVVKLQSLPSDDRFIRLFANDCKYLRYLQIKDPIEMNEFELIRAKNYESKNAVYLKVNIEDVNTLHAFIRMFPNIQAIRLESKLPDEDGSIYGFLSEFKKLKIVKFNRHFKSCGFPPDSLYFNEFVNPVCRFFSPLVDKMSGLYLNR